MRGFIKPTSKPTYPKLEFNEHDFNNTFLDALEDINQNYFGYCFMATPEMLQKFNVVGFALNGQLEIVKISINLDKFEYSRTYQVNKKDCNRNWKLFRDLEEVRDFICSCEVKKNEVS